MGEKRVAYVAGGRVDAIMECEWRMQASKQCVKHRVSQLVGGRIMRGPAALERVKAEN